MWYQWTCQSNLLCSAVGQRPEHWECTHSGSHATAAPGAIPPVHFCFVCLSAASPFIFLIPLTLFWFSFLLLHNEIHTGCSDWDASCSSVLESQRARLLYSCSSCLSLGKTRWNVLRLTLTLLNSLSAVFPAEKRKMAGWQSSVRAFWSEEKVCNWGPWAGSLRYTSRRIIAWGYNTFSRRGGFFSACQMTSFPFLPFSASPLI